MSFIFEFEKNINKKSLELFDKFSKSNISYNEFKYLEKNSNSIPSIYFDNENNYNKKIVNSIFTDNEIKTIITLQTCNFLYEYIHYFWKDKNGEIFNIKTLKQNWITELFNCNYDELENKNYILEKVDDKVSDLEENELDILERNISDTNNNIHKFKCENKSVLHYVFTRL